MEIRRIAGESCKTARALWEEVFHEDSQKFTDYYFEHKAVHNVGYVIGESPYKAMMFRTPYPIQLGKKQKELSYLVGVATRKEDRHKGYMSGLLRYSLEEMYKEKQPFTFLMPANPAIYEPFDFQYIYERENWTFKDESKQVPWLESLMEGNVTTEEENILKAAQAKDTIKDRKLNGWYSATRLQQEEPDFSVTEQLADFANKYLEAHYEIYVWRTASYYERQLKESQAQNGDIFVYFKEGEVEAYFLYAREEGEIFLQEVLEKTPGTLDFLQKSEKKKPVIMARIVHLEEMLRLVKSKKSRNVILEVEDDLISKNDGVYRLEITPEGSKVTKLKEYRTPDYYCHIRDLAPQILKNVFINEIV